MELKEATIDMLGSARQVKVDKENTTIVEGAGNKEDIAGPRCLHPQRRSRTPPPTTTREKLQERLAKLAGGVAVIQVGAATEVEMKERKLRIEDALSRDPRRCGRGHRAWRRHRAAQRASPLCRLSWPTMPATSRPVWNIVLRALEEPAASDQQERRHRRQRRSWRSVKNSQARSAMATTRSRTSMWT